MGATTLVEIWRAIEGHPDYEVSSLGRVRSNKKSTPLVMRTRRDRYGHHKLELDGKTRKVHQLVALAFIPQPWETCPQRGQGCGLFCHYEPLCVRHLDDDKDNNAESNLSWGTYSQNLIDSYTNGRRPSKKHAK